MIEILESSKHLVAMKFSGDLTAEDVEEAYKAIEDAMKKVPRISMFVEIDPSVNLTFEGLFKDMVAGLGQIGKLNHYFRAAIVTDKGWMATMARVEGLVFTSVDIRVFSSAEREKAFAWAAEPPDRLPEPDEPSPSLHVIQTTSENVFAYQVDGRIREKDIETVVKAVNDAFKDREKVNVLARIRSWKGFDLASVFSDGLFKMKYDAFSKVDKYAIVGGPPWMRNFFELVNSLFPTEVRVFEESEEDAAWEWVGASQALLPN
ncbi:MAG TPA: STAS/SEC14 domain-containing protein [Pyrinomonadaceae bacterium]|nr:STAS/SEC14 domain-containing protein [Pyrinomonadaceae bacterium]HMP65783.1 STAS/SEC14 domain-containing protein [Pyrinomonadaceae bacterium]